MSETWNQGPFPEGRDEWIVIAIITLFFIYCKVTS